MVDAGGSGVRDADSEGASAGHGRHNHTQSDAPAGTQIIDAAAERGRRGCGPAAEAWLDESVADTPITEGIPPSWSDRFVRAASQRLGGPLGRRADTAGRWWNPVRWALLVATAVYLIGVLFRLKCRVTVAGESVDHFRWMCYSDIGILYQLRGLMQGNVPYLDSGSYPVLEYPVLTGWFLQLLRVISSALGAPTGSELSAQQQVDSTLVFVDVNTVVLGALLLVAVWAQARSVPHRPWDAIMVAASPCVAATALINWDLLPVALTALGVLAWARKRPGWAGIWWGLGMAAKLYPLFLLGPLLFLCLRSDRLREFARMLLAFAIAWFVVNAPVLWLAPDSWLSFWTFNSDRSGDLGSIWYVLSLAGQPVEDLNRLALAIFGLLCVAIAALILVAPRRPRIGQVMFLVVAAFLLTNKVYSPQYVLWLLPFVVLARPVWRDWLIFTVGELGYFAAIWWHLGGLLAPGADGPDKVYWLAVLVRMAAELWIVIVVVRDIWRPEHDVVRHPPGWDATFDDPTGGVLDGAGDVDWLPLRRRPVGPGSLGDPRFPSVDGDRSPQTLDGLRLPSRDGKGDPEADDPEADDPDHTP
ncbi:MAG TPA: glycosyltransferase 87 family protein [Microlunatus sp.]|nr:glycosyltransferase 87 family protein [Microlunatus sp.]